MVRVNKIKLFQFFIDCQQKVVKINHQICISVAIIFCKKVCYDEICHSYLLLFEPILFYLTYLFFIIVFSVQQHLIS